MGYTYTPGNGGLIPIAGYPVYLGTNRPGTFGIADMDGDGKAEIYLRDRIFAAENGKLLASEGAKLMSNTALWDVSVNSAPVAVDIQSAGADGGRMELVVGNRIYQIPNITNRNPGAPASLIVSKDMNTDAGITFDINGDGTRDTYFVKLMNDPVEYGLDTHSATSVADMDKDGFMDVILSGALNSSVGRTAVFYWNVQKNIVTGLVTPNSTQLGILAGDEPNFTSYQNGWIWGTGRVNIGDANGDGKLDLSFIAGSHLYCVTTNAPGTSLQTVWTQNLTVIPGFPSLGYRTINDSRSGVLTVTIYDFDNDGNPEMVYRDSQELVVIDGATGTIKHWSAVCQSHTYTEGPVIADVNGDGATDICATCNRNNSFDINDPIQQQALGEVRLFFSNGNEWLPTRKVWNQPGYFVVNINDDLTLPFPQLDQNLVFSNSPCPNGLPGPQTPFNVFLNQVPFLSSDGCPVFPAPDLSFVGDDPENLPFPPGDPRNFPAVIVIPPICGNLDIRVSFNIINDGDLPITDVIPVSFFHGDPTDPSITSDSLLFSTNITVNNLQVDDTVTTVPVVFNGPGVPFRLYIVLNNNGTVLPVDPLGSVSNECRIDNNIYDVFVTPDPFTAVIEKIRDNDKCVAADPNVGELRARMYKGAAIPANEIVDYSDYAFQWYFGTTATPGNEVPPAQGGNNYNLTDLMEGDYTLVTTNVSKGCSTIPVDTVVLLNTVIPAVTINKLSDQTQCSPPNGALEAVVAGGNTGFAFEWFSNALPLGVTTATASNLIAGNYSVVVSRNGCSANTGLLVADLAIEPDVTAVSTPVENCQNLNSGTISATALIGGVAQLPGEYTFDWYFYDNVTTTRGSSLPPIHGTGPNRTGLPAGFYEVVATRISTQCQSLPFVIEVMDGTILPTADITELAVQTSCDPANPNGRLQAIALVGGVPQDPANFTFEWFEGQNTLPANVHADVSGVNGSIAEKVKGGGQSYTVRITSVQLCSAIMDTVVTENVNVPIISLLATPNGICDPALASSNFTGSVAASVSFDGAPVVDFTNYTFQWYNGTQAIGAPRPETAPTLSPLDSGYYTLVVTRTDLACVSAPETDQVTNTTVLPVIAANANASTNCDPLLANGGVQVTDVDGLGTPASFDFEWHRGNTLAGYLVSSAAVSPDTLQGATGRFYTVFVTRNSDGCRNTETVEVLDASALPLITLLPSPNNICDPALTNPPVQFNGSVASTITNQGGFPIGDYEFTWTDDETATQILQATGLAGQNLVNRDSSYYTVVVEQLSTGCLSAPVTAEVTPAQDLPVIASDANPSTNCDPLLANGGVQVTDVDGLGVGAPFVFEWHRGNTTAGYLVSSAAVSLDTLQGATGRFYTVLVTNQGDGCQNTETVEVLDNRVLPLVTLLPSPNNICDPTLTNPPVQFNGSVASTITNQGGFPIGDYEFTWTDEETSSQIVQAIGLAGQNLVNRDSSYYTVVVEQLSTGCLSAPVTAEVTPAQDLPVIAADANPSTNCDPLLANGGVQVTDVDGLGVGAPFVFEWHRGNTTAGYLVSSAAVSLDTLQGATGRFYTALVTNQGDGCQNTETVEVLDNRVLPLVTLLPSANNICNPALTNPPVQFNGSVASTITNQGGFPIGDYEFTWTDDETATQVLQATGLAGQNLVNRDSSYYTVVVEQLSTGCLSAPVTAEVTPAQDLPVIAADANPSTNCDPLLANGGVQVTDVDGLGVGAPFVFEWHRGNTTAGYLVSSAAVSLDTLQGATGRFYTVLVTNQSDGCQNTDIVEVLDDKELPVITLVSTDNTICVGTPDGTASLSSVTYQGATVNAPSAFVGYSFNWSSSETTQSISNKAAAFYSLEVTRDDVGCTSDIVSIEVKDDLVIPAILLTSTPQTSCDPANLNGQSDAAVDVGGIPTTAGFNYRWFAGTDTTSLLNPINIDPVNSFTAIDLPGNVFYTVKITNATTRCENTRSIFLQEIIAIPRIELVPTDVTDCNTPGFVTANVFIDTNNDGIEEPLAPVDYVNYQFSWFRGSTITDPQLINTTTRLLQFLDDGITPIPVQNYTAFVVNTLTSCAAADVTTLINGPGPLFDIDVNVNFAPASCATNDGVITAFIDDGSPTGTTAGFTFEWHAGNITNGLQIPPPSFYTDPPVAFTLPVLDVDPLGFFGTVPYPIGQPLPNHQAPTSATTGPTLYGRPSGTFTIVATRNADGCKEYLTAFLPFQAEPVIIVADIVPDDCLGDNGSIGVDITVPVPNTPSDYKVWLIPGTNPTLTPGLPPPVFSGVVDPALAAGNLFSNLGPGIYTVVAQEDPLDIASGCFSSPVQVEMREALPPLLEVLAASFSTSCGVAPGDGSMQITFETDPSDPFNPAFPPPPPPINFSPGPQSYTVDVVDQSSTNIFSVGGFASGSIVNIPNLQNGDFDVTITSSQGCTITKTFTVPANPQVAELVDGDVITQNALFCNPILEANARVEVTNIAIVGGPADNFGDYRFDWFTDLALSANVYNDIGDPTAAAGGEIFENSINGVAPGTVIEGSYWIVATKVNAGATGGLGCFSAPFKVDILDDSEDPLFTLTPFSNTACDANFEGSLTVLVTDPGSVASPTYTYDWAATNPIDIEGGGGPIGGNDGDGSGADADGDNPLNLQDGTYQLTVINDVTGCSTTGQSTILKTTVPVIIATATPVNQLICNPDGSITVNDVTVGGVVDPVHTNFDFSWYVTDPNSAPVINAVNGVDVLNVGNLPTIGAGTYYVKARRIAGLNPGSGCESAQLRVDILDDSEDPLFTLTPFSNTACDANFEGSLTVLVTDPGSVASPTYTYDWAATNPIDIEGGGGPIGGNDGDGSGADADGDNPLNLQDGTYQLTVINDVTGCSTTGQSTILKTTVPVIIATATPVNQLICNPDGSITVNDVTVGGVIDPVHTNFDFSWYVTDPNSAPVINAVNGIDVLNVGNLPTIGAGTYYVKARRIAGLNPGSGCESAQLRVDILDLSEDPDVSFVFAPNTSCNPANPNGSIIATAVERDATTDVYTFNWTLNGGALPGITVQADATPVSQLTSAFEGDYVLSINNTLTGCNYAEGVTIDLDQTVSLPNIVNVLAVDPIDCFPTGSAQVVEITIGGTTTLTDPPDDINTTFDFEWYKGSFPGGLIAGQTNSLLPGQLPDTYFVLVEDLTTNCQSQPVQVVIDTTSIVYPDIQILQTLPQVSCDALVGTAALVSTADGQDDTNVNYTFTWYPSLDASGASFANTSTITNLVSGDYSVEVLNVTTNCQAASFYIIPDNAPQFLPQLSLSTTERTRCDLTDGSLLSRGVPYPVDPLEPLNNYPFPYNYTSELFVGPDVTGVSLGFMANDPLNPTFTSNFLQTGLAEGKFTVRLTDLNTSCVVVDTISVRDGRVLPVIVIVEDNPLTNCDPLRANGQLSATADGGLVGGYSFEWYSGPIVAGPILSSNNKLIGQLVGPYTVFVTNNLTGCSSDETGDITDATVLPPSPTALLVQPRTSCLVPNGWVTANVNGETLLHRFDWYDGSGVSGSPDSSGPDYTDLDVLDYTVTATDLVTGCTSPGVVIAVPDARVYPLVNPITTPSYCLTPSGSAIIELTPEYSTSVLTDIEWFDENGNSISVGPAAYELPAGTYSVVYTTSEGCVKDTIAVVGTEILSYNLVSVNSDGRNDVWIIDCLQNFPSNNVKVFNRSGVLVYEANGYNNVDVVFSGIGEKGVYAFGNELPDGTYFYIIDKRDGSKPITGYLELVR